MTLGLQVINDSGGVVLDTDYVQMNLVASGSAAATGTAISISGSLRELNTVTFPSTAQPLIFVRPRNIQTYVFTANVTSTTFKYRATGIIDYRVYNSNGGFSVANVGQGIQILDASGRAVYNTLGTPPYIQGIQDAVLDSDFAGLPNVTFSLVRTLSNSVTSYDGGLPYINQGCIGPLTVYRGSGYDGATALAAYFGSASSLSLYQAQIGGAGPNPNLATKYKANQWPRKIILIK